MKKAIVFDMDGLMIDSETATFKEYIKALNKRGYNYTLEDYVKLLGKPKEYAFYQLRKDYGQDFPMEEVWEEIHSSLEANLLAQYPFKEGLMELLQYLKQNQYKMVLATSSQRYKVNTRIQTWKLDEYLDDSICGDEVENGKPNPEIFLKACQKIQVTPEQAIVLEDSESGIMAAYNGNIDVICIPDMKYPEEQYASKAVCILKNLTEVIDYLEKNK